MTHRLAITIMLLCLTACGGVNEQDPCLAANPD